MSNKSSTSSSGIGFTGLLTITFIVLKLCNVITWPWLWVLSPAWIPLAFVALILVGCGGVWLVASTVVRWSEWKMTPEERARERERERALENICVGIKTIRNRR